MSEKTIAPAYCVPSMREIEQITPNGYSVASTFSGCGGSSLGYKLAGFAVLWANEFVAEAIEVYRANAPKTILDTRDIREITGAQMLDAIGLRQGELDILDGSPPCASFSTAGKRQEGWGQVKKYSSTRQRIDDLFFEYARLLEEVQPKTFVAENVSGLVKGAAKGYFIEILARLRAAGYVVGARLLDAQWLGVPQMRQRLIFVGVRSDLVEKYGVEPVWPKPLDYRYSVGDVLPHIDYVRYGGHVDNWKSAKTHPSATIVQSDATLSETAYLSSGGWVMSRGETRRYTIDELRSICSFPDDFVLTGSFAEQWERLGRAVPPVMMSRIAATIRDEVLCKIK